jgi:hypothetical protein
MSTEKTMRTRASTLFAPPPALLTPFVLLVAADAPRCQLPDLRVLSANAAGVTTNPQSLAIGGTIAAQIENAGKRDRERSVLGHVLRGHELLARIREFRRPRGRDRARPQVVMFNPWTFPSDPLRTSNGLDVILDGAVSSHGPDGGITLSLPGGAPLGGTVAFQFRMN